MASKLSKDETIRCYFDLLHRKTLTDSVKNIKFRATYVNVAFLNNYLKL
jgi:hypothetical protein